LLSRISVVAKVIAKIEELKGDKRRGRCEKMLENEESDRSKKRDMDVPGEKRISARCTASSQNTIFG
jgi:hypothetical protein